MGASGMLIREEHKCKNNGENPDVSCETEDTTIK